MISAMRLLMDPLAAASRWRAIRALFIVVESTQNLFPLPDDLLGPIDKVQFFSPCMRHF
jgi:hypothetical protein